MNNTSAVRATAAVNGAEIYYEMRGDGPPILCISGGFGDGGAWQSVAELLSDTYTVISYDRRGHSRSPRPEGWTTTSLDEQAADSAGLIESLGVGPCAIYANSLGGAIGLTLLLRRPELVRLAILHDPVIASLSPDPAQANSSLRKVVAPFIDRGDLAGAADTLLRVLNGEDGYAKLSPVQLERMVGNAETLLGIDFRGLGTLTVDIVAPAVPLTIACGAESADFLTAGARRLAELLQKELITLPGAHVPQLTHPTAVADLIRRTVGGVEHGAAFDSGVS
ncbi:alpha/beta fold hydrolase [Nocardia sp. NBC_01327]|uniref:alpha/beta fold hydrolase n=1 Tax=Nocardia sp. NBC_01327 TaxID=2903593 RepID=UPI002E1666B7|nr:alpha/beta hydrolase [Nocardia sp. NBC_01327]